MRVIMILLGVILVAVIPMSCGQKAEDPLEEVAVGDPLAEPGVDDPLAEPGVDDPLAEPGADDPLADPPADDPSADPPVENTTGPPIDAIVQSPTVPPIPTTPLAADVPDSVVLEHCLVSLIEEAQVPARVPAIEGGLLWELLVKEGEYVSEGQLLAKIDDARAVLQRNAADARLGVATEKAKSDIGVRYSKAAAKVAKAEYEVAVQTNLEVPNTVPMVEVRKLLLTANRAVLEIEQAELQERIDELEVEVSQAELDSADENIKRYQIVSPMDAVVRKVYRHRGEWVKPGDPVMHVVRIDTLRIEGFLSKEQFNPSEVRGRNVTVTVGLARGREASFQGKVTFVDPEVQSGGDYPVWAEVQNVQNSGHWILMPGLSATMTIHLR